MNSNEFFLYWTNSNLFVILLKLYFINFHPNNSNHFIVDNINIEMLIINGSKKHAFLHIKNL